MALPKNRTEISTNLNEQDLYRVCLALEAEPQPIKWIKHSEFAGSTIGFFEYRDRTYRMTETFELVDGITDVTGKVEF